MVYRASAGSGKTFRLAAEYIKLLITNPESYRRILAVTFTNKATAEMKGRILEELKRLAGGEISPMGQTIASETGIPLATIAQKAEMALTNILHDYSRFSVSTIDSFVQRIIQALLWELGQQGGTEIQLDYKPILERATDILLDESAHNLTLFRWLQTMGEVRLESEKSWDIRNTLLQLGKELFSESFRLLSSQQVSTLTDLASINKLKGILNDQQGKIARSIQSRGVAALDSIRKVGLTSSVFFQGSRGVYGFFDKCSRLETGDSLPPSDNSYVRSALGSPDGTNWVKAEIRRDRMKFEMISSLVQGQLHPLLNELIDLIEQSRAEYNTSRLVLKNLDSLAILSDLWHTIRRLSIEEGFMLLADSGPLLREFVKETDAPFVYEKAGTRYDCFMIDEFQDTSVIQWQNFKPLIGNSLAQNDFSMVVGDIKQAIYRWRNGDWRILASGLSADFAQFGLLFRELNVNRRSLPAIVNFNNSFFAAAVDRVEVELRGLTEAATPQLVENLVGQLRMAYEGLAQDCAARGADEGYVEINLVPDTKESAYDDNLFRQLPNLISEIQQRGYRAGDIAILVRKNDHGHTIANHLLEFKASNPDAYGSFDVVSQDGLLLASSPAVRLCVAAIRMLQQPDNTVNRAAMSKELKVLGYLDHLEWNQVFSGEYIEAEREWLLGFRTRPLQEIFEAVVQRYGLLTMIRELAYIAELHEQIVALSRKGPGSVDRFLDWWDETGETLSLSIPESKDAITIMSIHKSKGLQFPVVIIPYSDWEFRKRGAGSILWVNTDSKPFDALPQYPVFEGSEMKSSLFDAFAYNEEMQTLVDNLNLLYVAFTRPERELYIFCPHPGADGTRKKLSTTGPLIKDSLSSMAMDGFAPNDLTDSRGIPYLSYSTGKRQKAYGVAKKNDQSESWTLESYPVNPRPGMIKQRLEANDFFRERQSIHEAIRHGKTLHTLFSHIKYANDVDDALHTMQNQGLIAESERNTLKARIDDILSSQPYCNWFSRNWEILTETSIITPEGYTYRPDRVMVKGNQAIIVDYKFGGESPAHLSQVRRYISLIQSMGYTNTEGYLWYVDRSVCVRI